MTDQIELDIQNNPEDRGEPAQQPQTQPAPPPAAPPQISIEVRIEQYIKLRDMIKAEDDKHKKKMEPARATLETLNGVMLNHLNQIGGDSVRSKSGTVYKTTKRSASLEDADAFMRFVVEKEMFELLDRKANVSAVEAFIQENGVQPPGVKLTSTQVVGVRRS